MILCVFEINQDYLADFVFALFLCLKLFDGFRKVVKILTAKYCEKWGCFIEPKSKGGGVVTGYPTNTPRNKK